MLKYHGLRDPALNIPYHDSVSVCTAPSRTKTTVEFGYETDRCLVNGDPIDEEGRERATTVLDIVRRRSGIETGARVESENSFPSNVGLGASASAYAALALASSEAAGLDLSRGALSTLARRGAPSAARSVAGGFSRLRASSDSVDCRAVRLEDGFDDDVRIVVCHVPRRKFTSRAHEETPRSHLYTGRLAYVHGARARIERGIRDGDFEATFAAVERDSISLFGATMTAEGWIYWEPTTLRLLRTARRLRDAGVTVYFSCDTGATAYLNTTAEYVDAVVEAVAELGIDREVWRVAGPARSVEAHLF